MGVAHTVGHRVLKNSEQLKQYIINKGCAPDFKYSVGFLTYKKDMKKNQLPNLQFQADFLKICFMRYRRKV